MSSHKFILELSPAAYEDRVNIIHGTALKWGDEQAMIYHDAIDKALDTLCLNHNIGHISQDLPGEYRLYLVRSHVIVYKARQGMISVSRILDQRMSISLHV